MCRFQAYKPEPLWNRLESMPSIYFNMTVAFFVYTYHLTRRVKNVSYVTLNFQI